MKTPDILIKKAEELEAKMQRIFPALAPQSRLSIIPSAAIENAGTISSLIFEKSIPITRRFFGAIRLLGIEPTSVTTGFLNTHIFIISTTMIDASDDGTYADHFFG